MDVLSFDWLFSPSSHDDPHLRAGDRASGPPRPSPESSVPASVPQGINESFMSRLANLRSGTGDAIRPTQSAGVQGPNAIASWFGGHSSSSSSSPSAGGEAASNDGPALMSMEPGMWTFVTSRYAITLLFMGVLVNRIHHICRPRGNRPGRMRGWKRLAFRAPALVALSYATVALGLRIVQLWAGDFVPGQSWLADRIAGVTSLRLDEARRMTDERLLWATYVAACINIVTEALTRTLEASHEPSPSFNLLGFALTIQSHQMEPSHVSLHFFLFVFLEIAEIASLTLMACWRKPPIKRLHITTVFGLAATAHYLLAPAHRRPVVFGFNKMPEVVMLGVVILTMALHSLTMLATEGSIDTGRLLFSRSNLPSTSDEYSLALFKLGTACLHSTRLTGLSKELTSIEIPEKTYIEVDDFGGTHIKTGLEGLIRGENAEGLHNEIRITTPVSRTGGGWGGSSEYESSILMSAAKWREVKRFLFAVIGLAGTFWRAMTSRIPRLPTVWVRRCAPHWLQKVPMWIRLVWHGRNGERRREERLARLRTEQARQEELRKEALRAALRRNGVELAEGEDENLAIWRAMKSGVQGREEGMRNRRTEERNEGTAEDTGISSTLWRHLLSATTEFAAQPTVSSADDEIEDDEEDLDWTPDSPSSSASEDESESASAFTSPLKRGRNTRSRSSTPVVSSATARDAAAAAAIARSTLGRHIPSSIEQRSLRGDSVASELLDRLGSDDEDEDAEVEAEAEEETPLSLLQLARRAFSPGPEIDSAEASHAADGSSSEAFSRVLLVHAATPDGSPIVTRARYRSLIASSGADQGSMTVARFRNPSTEAGEHLRQTVLRRRHPAPQTGLSSGTSDEADESRAAERERLRLCVVCCYEERTILCWPCRCLALCDGCREELASRPGRAMGTAAAGGRGGGGGLHNCPTCRAEVRGFSRIYLP